VTYLPFPHFFGEAESIGITLVLGNGVAGCTLGVTELGSVSNSLYPASPLKLLWQGSFQIVAQAA
jgi:hypothetical protein